MPMRLGVDLEEDRIPNEHEAMTCHRLLFAIELNKTHAHPFRNAVTHHVFKLNS